MHDQLNVKRMFSDIPVTIIHVFYCILDTVSKRKFLLLCVSHNLCESSDGPKFEQYTQSLNQMVTKSKIQKNKLFLSINRNFLKYVFDIMFPGLDLLKLYFRSERNTSN